MAALLLTRRSTAACRLLRLAISSSSSTSSSSPIPPPITNTALPPQHHDKPLFFSSPKPITNTTTQYHHLPTPTKLRFFPTSFKPSPTIAPFLSSTRFLSSSSPQDGVGTEKAAPAMKHQEIEGPTVERDLSALAQETRQVLENLQRVLYDLSKYMAILALAHLASGAWIAYHASLPRRLCRRGASFARRSPHRRLHHLGLRGVRLPLLRRIPTPEVGPAHEVLPEDGGAGPVADPDPLPPSLQVLESPALEASPCLELINSNTRTSMTCCPLTCGDLRLSH